ncbi:MAG: hypothetical protein ACRD6W_08750 [Nitrososphaerales archaeon]
MPNGLSLCKIHHAAYDVTILGVRSDLVVEVAPHLVKEVNGPMLTHGLQGMAGVRLLIPRERAAQPIQKDWKIGTRSSEPQAELALWTIPFSVQGPPTSEPKATCAERRAECWSSLSNPEVDSRLQRSALLSEGI